jgi:hypothetical protein
MIFPLQKRKYRKRSIEERFWSKVNKNGPIIVTELGPCWEWIASTRHGYGQFGICENNIAVASRFSWELVYGKIDSKLGVYHKCDNPLCVNTNHLFKGSQLDNIRDAIKKGRFYRKLTETQALDIKERRFKGEEALSIVKDYPFITRATVYDITKGSSWKKLGEVK